MPGKSHGQRSLAGYIVHGVSKNWTKKENESDTTEHAHTTKNYMMGNSHLKSIPIMMVGTVCCWRRPSVPGDRELSSCWPGDRVWDPFSCWGTHNTCSIIGYSKSVCIWKVLYVTVIMHPGRPLAQLLTFASHSSGRGAHRGFGVREKAGGRLVYQGKQSFSRKGSRLDR